MTNYDNINVYRNGWDRNNNNNNNNNRNNRDKTSLAIATCPSIYYQLLGAIAFIIIATTTASLL